MYILNVDTGDVDGGFVIMFESYKTMNYPLTIPDVDSGFENLIKYPVPSSETNEHGVVEVVNEFNPLLQLLVKTAVLTIIGLGINKLNDPPISILLSIFNLIV